MPCHLYTVYLQTFDALVEMAERGDHRKVDTMSDNLSNKTGSEQDWYSVWTDDIVVYSLGKLTSNLHKEGESTTRRFLSKFSTGRAIVGSIWTPKHKIKISRESLSRHEIMIFFIIATNVRFEIAPT